MAKKDEAKKPENQPENGEAKGAGANASPQPPQPQDRMQRSPGDTRVVRENVITPTGASYGIGQRVTPEQAQKDKLQDKYLR